MTLPSEFDEQRPVLLRRIAIAGGLLACVGIGLVFPFPLEGRLWGELFDLAHAPVFCATLLLIVGLCDPPAIGLSNRHQVLLPMTTPRIAGVAVGLIAAGAGAEVLQTLVGRNASLADIAANGVGVIAGISWVLGCRSQSPASKRTYAFATVTLLLTISISPLLDAWDCLLQIRSFPMLASFERPREFHNWNCHSAKLSQSDEWATDGHHCAKLNLSAGNYPGMLMSWFERDWSKHSYLHLDLNNPSSIDLQIVLKLHDHQHVYNGFPSDDRFHEVILVPAGQVITMQIPLSNVRNSPANRQMDLGQMWTIDLFAIHLQEPAVLLVDGLRLQ
ncbi:MAG: hypothetical protein ABJZ55_22530 [Fuerstiella sp.]